MRFRITHNTIMKIFEDRVALAHLKTRRFHVLNSTATFVWQRLNQGESPLQIARDLENEFQIGFKEAQEAVKRLINELQNEDFLAVEP
jgi:hypothetical protein